MIVLDHLAVRKMRRAVVLFLLFVGNEAVAASADVNIHLEYTTHVYRVRPKPGTKTSTLKSDIVLHPDGRIEENLQHLGRHLRTELIKNQKLGDNPASILQFRVIDENTISRTFDDGVLSGVTKIAVDGKTCKATVELKMNPTLKEYQDYSTELGEKAYYRDLKVLQAKCTIR